MCKEREKPSDSLHLDENDPLQFISEIIPCLHPIFPTPRHLSHPCSVQKSYPVTLLQDRQDWLSSSYFDSFPSHASKSFHLDGRRARWWFLPVVRTGIQNLSTPQAALCSIVDKPVHHFAKLQHLASPLEALMCITRFKNWLNGDIVFSFVFVFEYLGAPWSKRCDKVKVQDNRIKIVPSMNEIWAFC